MTSAPWFLLLFFVSSVHGNYKYVHFMEPHANYDRTETQDSLPEIFCYKGNSKGLLRIWETIYLQVKLDGDFVQFDGHTPDEVLHQFEEQKFSWNFFSNFMNGKKKRIRLYPFNQTCIGIVSSRQFSVKLHKITIDYWKVLSLIGGISLFCYSPLLASNNLFYYMTGVSVGTLASFLILIFILSRLFPRKPLMYGFLAGGWAVVTYIASLAWDNMKTLVMEYSGWVGGYAATSAIISFAVCYRYGPVKDPRTKDLIRWALQGFGVGLIYLSTEFQEASLAIIWILLTSYNLSHRFKPAFKWITGYFRKLYWKALPPARRFLSEDEYQRQTVEETKKALHELRGYCSSPECNQWKTMLRLKHPLRFAQFVEGGSHLSDDEVLEANNRNFGLGQMLTDDSESEEE